jgi:hypothetical protein
LASYFYATMIWVVTPLVLIWIYKKQQPACYRRARTTLLIGTGFALIVYMALPTAPPRLLPGAGFHDIVSRSHHWGWWSGHSSDAPRGLGSAANQSP